MRLPKHAADHFDVAERVAGNATTEFGAPNIVTPSDRRPLTAAQARREAALVAACWDVLADVAAAAPAVLRKGPRGGGRDRDPIVQHVADAEKQYARTFAIDARGLDTAAFRAALVAAVGAARSGDPLVDKGWPVRSMTRRIAWHALDHAWEIEDKS